MGRAWLASNDAGSGAYRLIPETYVPLEKVDMERNEAHFMGWSHNPNPIRRVEIRPTKETSTRVLALLNGSLDLTDTYLPVDQVENIEKSKVAHVNRNQTMRIFLIRMNNTKPPFDNINARKCFAHAFNYGGFIGEILKGNAQRDPTPLPNTIWGFLKDAAGYDYDLKKAKEFYQKAVADGAPMKRPIEIHILQQLEQTTQAAQVFQADLATLGINLKIVGDTFANLTTSAGKPETTPDMWIHWVSTYMVDPENWVGQMYDSQFHGTWKASAWYKNPKVDDLAAQGARPRRAERAGAALRGGDQADRRRLSGYLDLQHDRACRYVEPGQRRPLLPGRQRLRGALDEPVGIERRCSALFSGAC